MIFAMHLMYVDLASQSAIINYLWTGSRTAPRFPFGARTTISWTISLGWGNKYTGPCFNQYIPAWLPTRRCKILLETVPRRQRRLTWWWHGPSEWKSNRLDNLTHCHFQGKLKRDRDINHIPMYPIDRQNYSSDLFLIGHNVQTWCNNRQESPP